MYMNHRRKLIIGLGGVLLIDVCSYVVSFLCYFAVRKGKHIVPRAAELKSDLVGAETTVERFFREMGEGFKFLRGNINIVMLGISWALFLGAMLTGVVVIGPLSDKVFHAGATGYGWLNGGWGVGAFLSTLYTSQLIAWIGARRSIAISMGALAICISVAPLSPMLAIAVVFFGIMGSARGVSGVQKVVRVVEIVSEAELAELQPKPAAAPASGKP